jgi:hypothetical protein
MLLALRPSNTSMPQSPMSAAVSPNWPLAADRMLLR